MITISNYSSNLFLPCIVYMLLGWFQITLDIYNQTDGELFFYQNIILYYPLLNTTQN